MDKTYRKYGLLEDSVKALNSFLLIVFFTYLIYKGDMVTANALVIYNYYPTVTDITYWLSNMMKKY